MVVEKLISEQGEYTFRLPRHRMDFLEEVRTLYYNYIYWYDGRKFLIGSYRKNGGNTLMLEVETGAAAVFRDSKCSVEVIIGAFKQSLEKSGMTIHEVVQRAKTKIIDLDLCVTNLLIG